MAMVYYGIGQMNDPSKPKRPPKPRTEAHKAADRARWRAWRKAHPGPVRPTRNQRAAEKQAQRDAAKAALQAIRDQQPIEGVPVDGLPIVDDQLVDECLVRYEQAQSDSRPDAVNVPAIRRIEHLTDAQKDALRAAIVAGAYPETALRAMGVNKRTLKGWQEKAEVWPQSAWAQLVEGLANVEAESENSLVKVIARAAESRWGAAAWILERRFPDRWSRRDTVSDLPKIVVNVGIKLPGLGE